MLTFGETPWSQRCLAQG